MFAGSRSLDLSRLRNDIEVEFTTFDGPNKVQKVHRVTAVRYHSSSPQLI